MLQYGCNPTGMTATLERRKEVLELAREHNFLILEGRILRISSMLHVVLFEFQMIHTITFTTERLLGQRRTLVSNWTNPK